MAYPEQQLSRGTVIGGALNHDAMKQARREIPQIVSNANAELDRETSRLHHCLDDLNDTLSALVDRLQPVTSMANIASPGSAAGAAETEPMSPLGGVVRSATYKAESIANRLRAQIDLLAV